MGMLEAVGGIPVVLNPWGSKNGEITNATIVTAIMPTILTIKIF